MKILNEEEIKSRLDSGVPDLDRSIQWLIYRELKEIRDGMTIVNLLEPKKEPKEKPKKKTKVEPKAKRKVK
jgi:hypothetical protein